MLLQCSRQNQDNPKIDPRKLATQHSVGTAWGQHRKTKNETSPGQHRPRNTRGAAHQPLTTSPKSAQTQLGSSQDQEGRDFTLKTSFLIFFARTKTTSQSACQTACKTVCCYLESKVGTKLAYFINSFQGAPERAQGGPQANPMRPRKIPGSFKSARDRPNMSSRYPRSSFRTPKVIALHHPNKFNRAAGQPSPASPANSSP